MVCLPIAGLAWLGVRVARDDEAALHQRLEKVFAVQLRDIDSTIRRHFEALLIKLRTTARQVGDSGSNSDEIRELIRSSPQVRQILILDKTGAVVHPNLTEPLNLSEREFLLEAQELIRDRDLIRASGIQSRPAQSSRSVKTPLSRQVVTSNEQPAGADEGWHSWYWGRGVHLLFWQQRPTDGSVVGILVERGRWMADLIAALPETAELEYEGVAVATTSRFRLVDSMGQSIYEWGGYEPPAEASPLVEFAVGAPLSSWRLQAIVPDTLLAGARQGFVFQLASTIGAAALALAVIAAFFWREYAREIRQASQRVSFVNQVSHELKTPLTNIRMYADLLAADLESSDTTTDGKPTDRLRIIVSESQRLSRLIGNVLTFGRQQRDALVLRPRRASTDAIVRRVVEQFAPTLDRLGIRCELDLAAETPVCIDEDVVEQILVNLISNVEKYAADGGLLKITTTVAGTVLRIIVSDAGPGVPLAMRNSIFEPFIRVSNRLEDAAGTGIGLSIARDLARLHGGDLQLSDRRPGADFQVHLQVANEEELA